MKIIFLFPQMYQKVKKQNTLTVDNVKSVLQNKFPSANVQDILGIHSIYDDERKVTWNANFQKYDPRPFYYILMNKLSQYN